MFGNLSRAPLQVSSVTSVEAVDSISIHGQLLSAFGLGGSRIESEAFEWLFPTVLASVPTKS